MNTEHFEEVINLNPSKMVNAGIALPTFLWMLEHMKRSTNTIKLDVSLEALTTDLRLSKETITRQIKKLINDGYILPKAETRYSRTYRISKRIAFKTLEPMLISKE